MILFPSPAAPGVIHIKSLQGFTEDLLTLGVQPHTGLRCFCSLPPATPGVIHIKPLRGFYRKEYFNGGFHIKPLRGFVEGSVAQASSLSLRKQDAYVTFFN
jgi:hypothetical protein